MLGTKYLLMNMEGPVLTLMEPTDQTWRWSCSVELSHSRLDVFLSTSWELGS